MKIGIDVTEVLRIRKAVEKNSAFLERVFTDNEIAYFSKSGIKWDSVAGNYAVKEAYSKYIGTGIGEIAFKDIELFHDEKGEPYLVIKNEKSSVSVSITHTDNIAIAVVCGEDKKVRLHSDYIKSLLPKRTDDANKAQCGKVFILAGSKGMIGAAALSAKGALRCGAGLVTVGTADEERSVLASKLTEAMTVGFSSISGQLCLSDKEKIKEMADKSEVFVIGPGMGREEETQALILWLIENVSAPMVIDADGLNALSLNIDILKSRKTTTILTPHEGEMGKLLGIPSLDVKNNREEVAKKFAREHNAILVLKGKDTIVTDGEKIFVNPTGNSGMATGGSGDVLSGVLGSLLGQGMSGYDAGVLGVYIHGLAGDIGTLDKGKMGLIASDIAENLPYAIKELSGE
ncbi:MAG: NAD(P)H-hydrate dehydratase [Clostridia bacterium]|nr:NAD(P)H-hydrate dehydratase [Clostridia bacterium]